jgi:hypothetical protein
MSIVALIAILGLNPRKPERRGTPSPNLANPLSHSY